MIGPGEGAEWVVVFIAARQDCEIFSNSWCFSVPGRPLMVCTGPVHVIKVSNSPRAEEGLIRVLIESDADANQRRNQMCIS